MLRQIIVPPAVLALFAGLLALGPLLAADAQDDPAAAGRPGEGWTLHVVAKMHFPGDPEALAHHYCKPVAGGMIECLLFASDEPDARLVGVEVIVDTATWESFDPAEQALWHYHREEIPVVEATLPDLSPEEAAPIVESLQETYGKLYLLWDPTVEDLPVGEPSLSQFHLMAPEVTPAS